MADRAKDMRSDTLRIISIISIVAVTCIALEGLKLFGMISVGRIAAVLFLLLVSSRCGSSIAGALGLGLGIALDAGAGAICSSPWRWVQGLTAGRLKGADCPALWLCPRQRSCRLDGGDRRHTV
jgi:hypothetical protein